MSMYTLLGRDPIEIDVDASRFAGQIVLITGAGGSIGSELARQVAARGARRLVLFGHGESTLMNTLATIGQESVALDVVIGDVRDRLRVTEVFDTYRPDAVLHTAALKHVPLLERAPEEAVKTNILGTLNVLNAAVLSEVRTFINVSTDKAADPVSALGLSKRIGERLTAGYAMNHAGRYVSVRFGNVLGSRGSVLGTFARQIAEGGPLTVTHPDVDRYFMTAPEACSLVLHAGAIGRLGDALILDMGDSVRIVDIARRLAMLTIGHVPPIIYTGLRRGEKLHEGLLGEGEEDLRPRHPLIIHVPVPQLAPELAFRLDRVSSKLQAIDGMKALVRCSDCLRGMPS